MVIGTFFTAFVDKITQPGMNFEYEYGNRGNIISEKRNGLETKYQYDALGQLIYVNDPHESAIWYYTYDCGGNILEKKKYARNTDGTTGTLIETIPYEYGDSNWKDKLTKYNGKTITYDAIGNPLDDGERQYEWEAGRRLKKVTVKDDPANGIKDGYDAGSRTTLKLNFSNGNLFADGVTSTTVTAKVSKGERDITDEYAASAFVWTRNTGNASADAAWNAAHKGMKSVALSKSELTASAKVTCTLSGVSPSFGTVTVDGTYKVSHTRAEADENDTLHLENGILSITTEANTYQLEGNSLTANHPQLNGTVTAEAWVYTEVPTKVVEFKYNSEGLRVQKKVTANGETETIDYVYHGKLLTHMIHGNDHVHFFYDFCGHPIKLDYNGKVYTYVQNLQDDVVSVSDNDGKNVIEYIYDCFGNIVSIRTISTEYEKLSRLNPFKYRGYIMDDEINIYYLINRYFQPRVGRFINADELLSSDDILGLNLFAYCGNNPINRFDSTGEAWWHWVVGAAVVAACAIAVVVTAGGAAAGMMAVAAVSNGVAASTAASTIAAGAFIGSASVYGTTAFMALSESSSLDDFAQKGNTKTIVRTVGGAALGGIAGKHLYDVTKRRQPFLPDNYCNGKKAPNYYTPGSRYTNIRYNPKTQKWEYSTAYYDYAGRQCIRIDWTNHGRIDHSDPHVHIIIYSNEFVDGFSRRYD